MHAKNKPSPSLLRPLARRLGVLGLCAALMLPFNAVQAQSSGGHRLPNLGDGAELPLGVERRLGESIAREIYRDPDYVDDPVLGDYIQSIWQPLLAAARQRGELTPELDQQFAWDVALIRDRSINAFALPGGYLGVHLGLIAAVNSGDELASVLAHELSHVTQRHIARMIAQQGRQGPMVIGAMILGMLAASRTANPSSMSAANAVMVGGQAAAMQSQLNFSRDMEREADRVGYGVMTDAGYEPQGFVTMFEKLQQASRLNDNGSFPYLRSHPMTTERIADAQARQQLLPPQPAAITTPLHAMMAARAQVLTNPGVDVLRALAAHADVAALATAPSARQAGVLYAAVMAEMRQRNFAVARQHLARLQALATPSLNADAQRVVRLLAAELALTANDTMTALRVLSTPLALKPDRASLMLLTQARVATRQPEQAQLAADALRLWLSQRPRDASAWLLLVSAYELQGDNLRAIRAQAEARAVELDYPAAVDRLKAAQSLAHSMAREGKLDRGGHIEASIVDARLRELEGLRREQALQR
ncbi:M48 family metalloprotease [Limnohabitans sp.]|uniref:M48 family metalloprotease n=1 Tax=Limnohabitans sp. TaxID=1907725 RepID=UPI00286EC1D4|nr:M48 family metalloprotease [Limnohabitans sp.]